MARALSAALAVLAVCGHATSLAGPSASAEIAGSRGASAAAPPELRSLEPHAALIGEGEMRFLGLAVYRARLWAPRRFEIEAYAGHPFLLELIYARALSGQAIADRSLSEMHRLSAATAAQEQRWLGFMRASFADVTPGDRLSAWSDGRGTVRVFHNARVQGQLQDAEFARIFFGIWLDEHTSAPALREALGGAPSPLERRASGS